MQEPRIPILEFYPRTRCRLVRPMVYGGVSLTTGCGSFQRRRVHFSLETTAPIVAKVSGGKSGSLQGRSMVQLSAMGALFQQARPSFFLLHPSFLLFPFS